MDITEKLLNAVKQAAIDKSVEVNEYGHGALKMKRQLEHQIQGIKLVADELGCLHEPHFENAIKCHVEKYFTNVI